MASVRRWLMVGGPLHGSVQETDSDHVVKYAESPESFRPDPEVSVPLPAPEVYVAWQPPVRFENGERHPRVLLMQDLEWREVTHQLAVYADALLAAGRRGDMP
jgi:hypothetical protein